jgi:hypothetical protein
MTSTFLLGALTRPEPGTTIASLTFFATFWPDFLDDGAAPVSSIRLLVATANEHLVDVQIIERAGLQAHVVNASLDGIAFVASFSLSGVWHDVID